ncbi:hypothetical protein CEXT_60721 [Caerostris extrusa]|uniref:Uncharacterized protein n=1 Tax=Caerostris extrusa TaxID=172846 RepID=A0AAV4XEW4_CAEEX|nr:hypothetical protein CEXT_60721 [Caerostris extrusa]
MRLDPGQWHRRVSGRGQPVGPGDLESRFSVYHLRNKLSWRNILPPWKLGYVTGRLVRARVARFRDTRERSAQSHYVVTSGWNMRRVGALGANTAQD